jgi:hypothetical protein
MGYDFSTIVTYLFTVVCVCLSEAHRRHIRCISDLSITLIRESVGVLKKILEKILWYQILYVYLQNLLIMGVLYKTD